MSWTRYMFHDFYTAKEFNRMDDRLRRMRMQSGASRANLLDRVDELEDDLCRMSLILHAVVEASVNKGVLTREEISDMVEQIDLLDGQADGKLDPAALDPSREARAARQLSTEEHLNRLEKEAQTPGEFLSNLEDEHSDDKKGND